MERQTQVLGQSGVFLDALERASRAAALDRPVLVIGERGTGKELVAEGFAPSQSHRSDRPLDQVINCAAMPAHADRKPRLFGHEKGAFTGADQAARAAVFERADTAAPCSSMKSATLSPRRRKPTTAPRPRKTARSQRDRLVEKVIQVDVRFDLPPPTVHLGEMVQTPRVPRGPVLTGSERRGTLTLPPLAPAGLGDMAQTGRRRS